MRVQGQKTRGGGRQTPPLPTFIGLITRKYKDIIIYSFLVYGSWFTVPSLQFLIYSSLNCSWFTVSGLLFLVYSSWFTVPSLQFLIYSSLNCSWFSVSGLQFLVYSSWFTVPDLQFLTVIKRHFLITRNYKDNIIYSFLQGVPRNMTVGK